MNVLSFAVQANVWCNACSELAVVPWCRWAKAGSLSCAKPSCAESQVWIIYGDGSLGYSLLAEFDVTCQRHNTPVGAKLTCIIVYNVYNM